MYKTEDLSKEKEVNAWSYLKLKRTLTISSYVSQIELNEDKFCAVTNSRINFYKVNNQKCTDEAHFIDANCCKIRNDGQTMVVGTKKGYVLLKVIQGISMKKTSYIRSIKAHTDKINRIEYLWRYNTVQEEVASISEDGTLVISNITEEKILKTFSHSNVALQGLCVLKSHPNIVATGSIDHHVRIYDIEQSEPIYVINTELKVFSIVFPFETTGMILAVCESFVKVYDTTTLDTESTTIATPLRVCSLHYLQITDIVMAKDFNTGESVFITSSLDGSVKVTSLVNYNEIYKYETNVAIHTLKVTQDCKYMIMSGCTGNDVTKSFLYVRHLKLPKSENVKSEIGSSFREIVEMSKKYDEIEEVVEHKSFSKKNFKKFDILLKKHNHRQAWMHAILNRDMRNNPESMKNAISRLYKLHVLSTVVKMRDPKSIDKMMEIVRKYITDYRYYNEMLLLYEAIIDAYPRISLENAEWANIRDKINGLIKYSRRMERLKFDIKEMMPSQTHASNRTLFPRGTNTEEESNQNSNLMETDVIN